MFKIFLFLPIFLLASEFFTLPNDANHLNYTISQDIKKATKEIYIFTQNLNSYEISKALSKSAKRNIKINIITLKNKDEKNNAFRLVLYKNISVFTLKSTSKTPNGSLICIDNKNLFFLSDIINFKSFQNNISFATKTSLISQKKDKLNCKNIFKDLLQESEVY